MTQKYKKKIIESKKIHVVLKTCSRHDNTSICVWKCGSGCGLKCFFLNILK